MLCIKMYLFSIISNTSQKGISRHWGGRRFFIYELSVFLHIGYVYHISIIGYIINLIFYFYISGMFLVLTAL